MQGEATGANGRLETHALKDLMVIRAIQRTPKASRLRALGRHGWLPKKQGVLLVARITNGKYKGRLHIYDGGTRYELALELAPGGEEYVMPCLVTALTYAEAAERFDTHNSESKKPSAYDHYKVGIAYNEPHQKAIKRALDKLGLEGGEVSRYGNGVPGEVAALAACKRIVEVAYLQDTDPVNTRRWTHASDRLADVLRIMREAYEDPTAHDADMLQAVGVIRALSGPFDAAVREHLVVTIQSKTAKDWRLDAAAKYYQGGSTSRGQLISQMLSTEHNRTAPEEAALRM